MRRLLPQSTRPPQQTGGSASTISLSRPAQASLALRPAGSLSRPGEDSGEQLIGEVRGVAVYSPNRSRTVRIPIDPDLARQVKGRRIKVGFVTPAKAGGRTLAENQFVIR